MKSISPAFVSLLLLLIAGAHSVYSQFNACYSEFPSDTLGSIGEEPAHLLPIPGDGFLYAINDFGVKVHVKRIKEDGSTSWTSSFGFWNGMQIHDGDLTSDGGSIWGGFVDFIDAQIFKLDSLGNLEWNWVFDSVGVTTAITYVRQTSDGGYLASGFLNGTIQRPVLFKFDALGNEEWTWFGEDSYEILSGYEEGTVLELPDSTLMLTTVEIMPGWVDSVFAYKIDLAGNTISKVPIRSTTSIYFGKRQLFLTDAGKVFLTEWFGFWFGVSEPYFRIYELDHSGNLLSSHILEPDSIGTQDYIYIGGDGSIYVGVDDSAYYPEIYPELVKLNPDYSLAWYRSYKDCVDLIAGGCQSNYRHWVSDDRLYLSGFNCPAGGVSPGGSGVYMMDTSGLILCSAVQGQVYYDQNGNGVFDPGEYVPEPVSVRNHGQVVTATRDDGRYSFFRKPGDTLEITLDSIIYFNVTDPVSGQHTVLPDTSELVDSVDFSISPVPGVYDGSIQMTIANAFAVWPAIAQIDVWNSGVEDLDSVHLYFHLDSGLVYDSSSLAPLSISDSLISWILPSISIGEEYHLRLFLQTPDSTAAHCDSSWIEILAVDTNLLDNQVEVCWVSSSAYDPNNINVRLPQPVFDYTQDLRAYGYSPDSLEYLINFQNTGDTTAIDVRILDSLDARLDAGTARLIASSHPTELVMPAADVIGFVMDNIFLVDSSVSVTESQGFVRFSIHLEDSLGVGDELRNKADIFFDLNPPVSTAPALVFWSDVEQDTLSSLTESVRLPLNIWPNPADQYINLCPAGAENGVARLWLLDQSGRVGGQFDLVLQEECTKIRVAQVPPGLYQLMITQNARSWSGPLYKR